MEFIRLKLSYYFPEFRKRCICIKFTIPSCQSPLPSPGPLYPPQPRLSSPHLKPVPSPTATHQLSGIDDPWQCSLQADERFPSNCVYGGFVWLGFATMGRDQSSKLLVNLPLNGAFIKIFILGRFKFNQARWIWVL